MKVNKLIKYHFKHYYPAGPRLPAEGGLGEEVNLGEHEDLNSQFSILNSKFSILNSKFQIPNSFLSAGAAQHNGRGVLMFLNPLKWKQYEIYVQKQKYAD